LRHFLDNLTWQECGILSCLIVAIICFLVAAWDDRMNERRTLRGEGRFVAPRRWDQDLK
jgi:hypothetical protein